MLPSQSRGKNTAKGMPVWTVLPDMMLWLMSSVGVEPDRPFG